MDRDIRRAWRDAVVSARERFSADSLVGMTVQQARAVVEGAGGEFVTDDGPIAAKIDTNRLVASVVDGRVTRTDIG